MSDDLISRKAVIDILENMIFVAGKDLSKSYLLQDAKERISRLNIAFDKEKTIKELKQNRDIAEAEYKAVEEFGHDGSELLGKATAFNLAMAIVEKGGIE